MSFRPKGEIFFQVDGYQPTKLIQILWKSVWEGWKDIAQKIGNFHARLFLFIFYVVIVTPFALAIKFFADPLRLKTKTTSSDRN